MQPLLIPLPHGLAVRIAGSHPAGPGSTPGGGTQIFFVFEWHLCYVKVETHFVYVFYFIFPCVVQPSPNNGLEHLVVTVKFGALGHL